MINAAGRPAWEQIEEEEKTVYHAADFFNGLNLEQIITLFGADPPEEMTRLTRGLRSK